MEAMLFNKIIPAGPQGGPRGEDLGLEFETYLMDRAHALCANNTVIVFFALWTRCRRGCGRCWLFQGG